MTRTDDLSERAVLAIERLADALSVIVTVFMAAEPEDEDTTPMHPEHETPQ